MYDSHNHFTNENAILCTGELLPDRIIHPIDFNLLSESEIGLDRRYVNIMPKEKQTELLYTLLQYAKEKYIPITLHCVQFTQDLIMALRQIKMPENYVIWHGFNGSAEIAKEITKLGILISIGPRFNKDIKKLYGINPHVLLETDYEGKSKEEHNRIITDLYKNVSNIAKIPIEILEENFLNETKAFKNRIAYR